MKKLVTLIITFFTMIFIMTTGVNAESKINASLNANKKELKANQEVEITLNFNNYNNINKGINAYKATLEYDEEIFDKIYQKSFSALNNWEEILYNPDNKQFVSIKRSGSTKSENVAKIKLKLKKDITKTKTTIKVKNIIVSEGKKDIYVGEEKISLDLILEQQSIPTNTNNSMESKTSKTISSNLKTNENNVKTIVKDSNQKNIETKEDINNSDIDEAEKEQLKKESKKIQKTSHNYFWLFIIIIVEVILILLYLRKRKKDNENFNLSDRNKRFMFIFIGALLSIQFVGTACAAAYDFSKKGEVNGDDEINYSDVNLLELHLIDLKEIDDKYLENADINSDGKITVTDLTLLVQKLENMLDYEVKLSDLELENYYPNKNEELTLKFSGNVSYGATIEKVKVNGSEYETILNNDSTNEYSIKVNSENEAGIRKFKFTEVTLNNDKKIDVDYTIKVDILKDTPHIQKYKLTENTTDPDNLKATISFDFIDDDDSLVSGDIIIKDENDKAIKTFKIKKGKNNLEIPVKEGITYKAYINIKYDLDSNELEQDRDSSGVISLTKDIRLVTNYDIKIQNLSSYKNGVQSNVFDKKEPIQIHFESTNLSNYEPEEIIVNGRNFSTTKQNGVYVSNIDGFSILGDNAITIESIILENGKKLDVKDNNKISIRIVKRDPVISAFKTEENINDSKLNVNFKLSDEDDAIKTVKVILFNDKGNEISSKELTEEEIKSGLLISKTLNTEITSKYKIKIVSTYSKDTEDITKTLYEKEVEAKPNATIESVSADKKYVEKQGIVVLTYSVKSNKTNNVSKIRVNNTELIAEKIDSNKYKTSYVLGNTSGITNLTATQLTFDDNEVAQVNKSIKVDVLKDVPTVSDFTLNDDIANTSVNISFKINDLDNSFVSGKAILTNTVDGTTVSKEVKKGLNELTFKVKNAVKYTLDVKVSYDRDSTLNDDNFIENEILLTKTVQQLSDYEVKITDLKTKNGELDSSYFPKNKPITVSFGSTNLSDLIPVQASINGKIYDLTKNENTYTTTIDSYDTAGVKKLVIEKIIFDNSKQVKLNGKDSIKVEILKEKPVVKNFEYKENANNTVTMLFNLEDLDEAFKQGKIVVTDENDKEIKNVNIKSGKNEVTFELGSSEVYEVRIVSDYDLDTNSLDENSNEFINSVLDIQTINIGARLIEMKDIIEFSVYKQTKDEVVLVEKLKEADLANLNDYIVKVQMKKMPTLHTKIKEYRVDDNKLKLTLDYDNTVQYDGNTKQNKLELVYGNLKGGEATNISLESLAQKMAENPNGTFTLTRDYDASLLSNSSSNALFSDAFSGTLNGNGHKIYNLSKPLFGSLEAGTVKNLILENVSLSGSSRGMVANVSTNGNISNVHVKDLVFSTGLDASAGIIGDVTSTSIENCSVTNLNLTTAKIRIGGIAGHMTGGNITNCYVGGSITATSTKDGNGIGGIVGHAEAEPTTTIENCITKINFDNASGHRLNGAIIGLSMNGTTVLKNNVSLSTGEKVYRIHGSNIHASSTNNYELEESGLTTNASGNKVKTIAKDDINEDFFKDNANFDEDIWNLDGATYDNVPLLKGSISKEEIKVDAPSNKDLYIPDYSRIKKIHGFSESKEILYHNINKLMPYYDAKYLIEDGNKIKADDLLNEKIIKHVIPYNSEGKMLTYLTNNNHKNIAKIKVVFSDGKISEYNVIFKELKQNISIYEIEGLPLDYAYSNYVIEEDAAIVDTITDYIKNVDYAATLDPLTSAADARHYKDHYNETIKSLARTIALQLLQNDANSTLTLNSDILNNKIKQELIDSGKLNKILYAYNYYYRWYNFEIGGSKVSDLMFYEGQMYNDSMTIDNLTNEVLTGNMNVNATDGFFKSSLSKYTGSSELKYYLDGVIKNVGGYEDLNDWFTEYFGARNILGEFGVDGRDDILYRGWYQLKKNSRMILPVITMPENSTYMIAGPAHLQFGPAQLYHKDPHTTAGRNEIMKILNNHLTLVKRHFSTLAGTFDSERWNNYCIMVYDCTKIITGYKTSYLPGTNIPIGTKPVYTQGKVGSNYPFFKNFSEVLGLWQPAGSSAGVGNTAGFLWFQATPGLTNYDTWTHEFEHALYDKIMLFQRGSRLKLETLTQGNVEQRVNWSENNLVQDVGPYYFNTSFYLDKEGNATQNLTPERINTKEKLENYFKGQQNALDLLDYIEGKAFIKLTPEQQAKIATRMSISPGWSSWGTINAAQAEQMNLTSLEALYDNQIMLRPNNAWGVSVRGLNIINGIGANDYGFESVWVNRWFIGHLDGGYPDAFSAKRNFFEMLGYAGVDGYVTYGSYASSSDLDAIRKITKKVTGTAMDWKQYKMSRYATVAESLANNKYINVDYMIERFTEALTNDANRGDRNISQRTNLRKLYYHYLKSVTNDFVADPLGTDLEVVHIKTAEELVSKINAKPYGYYILDNDIDFSGMTSNVTETFMGKLDGNGHKITGNTKPIFQKIRYGYVKNLVIEGTNIPKNVANVGALSVRTETSVLESIQAKDINLNFGGRNEISLIGGTVSNVSYKDCTAETYKNTISSIDDLSKFTNDPSGIFTIENDIDFAGYTGTGSVIPGTFNGKIDGKGHTFKNLNGLSLFNQFSGTVENLNIKNFTNVNPGNTTSNDEIAAFAKKTSNATLRNMKFDSIVLEGRHRVAPVSAFDDSNSIFEQISVVNANVKGSGVYISTFIGRKYGGTIQDVYVSGTVECTTTENGGVVGAMQRGGTITNVISNVKVIKPNNTDSAKRQLNAGFVGNIYIDKGYSAPKITNSISIGSMIGYMEDDNEFVPYKFTGAIESVINLSLVNCYEYIDSTGTSSVNDNTINYLKAANRSDIYNRNFYEKTLAFNNRIWNLDKVAQNGYPTLN